MGCQNVLYKRKIAPKCSFNENSVLFFSLYSFSVCFPWIFQYYSDIISTNVFFIILITTYFFL